MYNDNKLISEDNLLNLKKEYEKCLYKTNVLNNENEDYFLKLKTIKINLLELKHYLENLIKNSKNLECLNVLKDVTQSVNKYLNDLNNLYDILEEPEININNEKNNFILSLNLVIDKFSDFLVLFYELVKSETNVKIKDCLENNFKQALSNLKDLNLLYKKVNTFKIFSLFKKY